MRRRLTIRSNPPGALVYVDNQEIGFTPVSTPFTYYGTREFKLLKDGFETLTVKQKIKTPWYQWPPLDFISDNFWPGETRDERFVDFQLEPQRIVPMRELVERGQQLRDSARQGYVAPLLNKTPLNNAPLNNTPPGPGVAPLPRNNHPAAGGFQTPPGASSYRISPPGERRFEATPARTPVQRPFYP